MVDLKCETDRGLFASEKMIRPMNLVNRLIHSISTPKHRDNRRLSNFWCTNAN